MQSPWESLSSTVVATTYCYSIRVWTDFGLGLGLGQSKDIAVVLIISLQQT